MGYGGYGPKTDDGGALAKVAQGVSGVASGVGSVISSGINYLGMKAGQ